MGILIKKLVFSVGKKKCKATESQKEPLNIIILQNNVCDSNHDLPKMLSKIGLEKKKVVSGRRKQITSATQGGWPQAWNVMST